jgi:hypothetical protein
MSSNLILLAADGDALGVGFLDGEPGAVLEILAEVRLVAGQRRPAQFDDHFLRVGGGEADAHQATATTVLFMLWISGVIRDGVWVKPKRARIVPKNECDACGNSMDA